MNTRKRAHGLPDRNATVTELVRALKTAPVAVHGLTRKQLDDVRDGERYRQSGRRGISLREAERILGSSRRSSSS
jgi:hypothetical protein